LAKELDHGFASSIGVPNPNIDFQPVARGKDNPFGEEGRTVSIKSTKAGKGLNQARAADGKSFTQDDRCGGVIDTDREDVNAQDILLLSPSGARWAVKIIIMAPGRPTSGF